MNTYMLICNNCGQKHFTDGSDTTGLVEIKTAPLPKNADGKNKETNPLPKKFKCYNCGYVFRVIKLTTPPEKPPKIIEEPKEVPSDEQYFKQWENEVLRSVRKKPLPPQV